MLEISYSVSSLASRGEPGLKWSRKKQLKESEIYMYCTVTTLVLKTGVS
jgi:hypothetical protein